jgi:regulator of sirC expression with transglutaminase-like and TPR domain
MITDAAQAETHLRALARVPDASIDLVEAALMLAALDRPRVALGRYRDHVASLCESVAAAADGDRVADRVAAINRILFETEGYDGDRLTYDDLQNANLIRVIDRRRGLPVSLGILYLHTARAQGWPAAGLCFPGHFLLRLDGAGERAIVDPFERGSVRTAAEMRALLRAMSGEEAELHPSYFEPAGNREILIRLQTNIELRHLRNGATERACRIAERVLWLAPDKALLWRDYGLLEAQLGNVDMAAAALETCIARSRSDRERHDAARLLQEIQSRQS